MQRPPSARPTTAHAPGAGLAPPRQDRYCAGTQLGDRKRKACRGQSTPQWAVAMRVLEEPGPQPTETGCGCVKPALETGNFWETSDSAPKRGPGAGPWPDFGTGCKMRQREPKWVVAVLAKPRITCTSDHVILLRRAAWCYLFRFW